MRALLVIALLLAPTSYAAVPLLAPQNDAGSGGDAGNDAGSALAVSLGRHVGQLATLPFYNVRDPLFDGSDWYAVHLEAGRRVSLILQNLGGESKVAELHRPDGTYAARVSAWSSGGHRVEVPVDVSGTWLVHISTSLSQGGAYAVALEQGPPETFVAFAGSGWLAATIDVTPETPFRGVTWTWPKFGQGPTRVDRLHLWENGSVASSFVTTDGEPDSFAIASGDVGVEANVRTYHSSASASGIEYNITKPGRHHIVIIVKAEDSYTYLMNATGSVAIATGSDVIAWRPTDMRPDAAVSAAPAEATLGASAHLRVSHRLVGVYMCDLPGVGICTVTPPGGSATPTARAVWGNGAPGVWTLTRDRAGMSSFGGYILLAADVRMP